MAVNYYLRQNKLGKDGKTYMANVISRGTFEHDYIIEVMLTRGSTVTRADILSVLSDYHDTIESFLQNGYNVKTPLANFSSSIRGIFNDYGEYYQEGRHKIYPVINPGKRLLRFYRERMKAHIVRPNQNRPRLNSFTDIVSGSKSKWITPGSMAEITGSLLKIDKESDTSGIFFINQKHERIKVAVIGMNTPSRLLFMIPANLPDDTYTLEIRTVIKNVVCTGQLSGSLFVQKG